MEKIYGYRQSDLISLANQVNKNQGKQLSAIFEDFALTHGKSKGTIRNLYYAMIKHCEQNKEFCNKYFNGKPPTVTKPKAFSKEQEQWLFDKMVDGIKQGKSVRQIVLNLAKGDAKLALRYQNKFRSSMLSRPELARELKQDKLRAKEQKNIASLIPETLLGRLKKEIDGLVERIAGKEKKQNEQLLKRVSFLEAENLRLSRMLYGRGDGTETIRYFNNRGGAHTVH